MADFRWSTPLFLASSVRHLDIKAVEDRGDKNQNLSFRQESPWTVRHTASEWLVTYTYVQAWFLQESFPVKLTSIAAESALAIMKLPDRDHDRIAGFSTLVPMTVGTATLRTDTDPKVRRRVSSKIAAKRGESSHIWRL